MIQIKIVRHSNRMDFSHPIRWMFYFEHYCSDSPLTETGYANAKEKGQVLASQGYVPDRIYTSPYNRTMATTTEIKASFPQTEIIMEPLLAEYQPRYSHAINLYPKGLPTTYEGQTTDFTYPETYENFSDRIQFIIGKLIEKNNSNIMVVTHGEVLRVYINHLQNLFPGLLLDPGTVPYLTVLSINIDKTTGQIVPESIRIE